MASTSLEYPFDVLDFNEAVVANENAQLWFNRGLLQSINFNHDEAVECFQRAAETVTKTARESAELSEGSLRFQG